jgi:hypothetical protein
LHGLKLAASNTSNKSGCCIKYKQRIVGGDERSSKILINWAVRGVYDIKQEKKNSLAGRVRAEE